MNEEEIRKKIQYKLISEFEHKEIHEEIEALFKRNTPKVAFFHTPVQPRHAYDLPEHCNHLDHVNYVCDVEKMEWVFCPICKIKTTWNYNSMATVGPWDEKTMGITVPEYWRTNQYFLDKCENLSTSPFQTRDEVLGHVKDMLKRGGNG